MGFFDDEDPFEEVLRDFLGGRRLGKNNSRQNNFIDGEEEERNIDFVEDEDYIYLIFELPGFNENDLSIKVAGSNLSIKTSKKDLKGVQGYLSEKLEKGNDIEKVLPKFVNPKGFSYKMKNGILEVIFNRR